MDLKECATSFGCGAKQAALTFAKSAVATAGTKIAIDLLGIDASYVAHIPTVVGTVIGVRAYDESLEKAETLDSVRSNPISFRIGQIAGLVGTSVATGILVASYNIAAINAPNMPANDNPAIKQNQSGKALSCENLAKKYGLELK